jgi:Transposase
MKRSTGPVPSRPTYPQTPPGPSPSNRVDTGHHISNGPTEAVNNLIKRVKRVAFGFRRFAHYRIRALLYAGKPNWDLLPTITPRAGGMPLCGAAGGVRRQG